MRIQVWSRNVHTFLHQVVFFCPAICAHLFWHPLAELIHCSDRYAMQQCTGFVAQAARQTKD